MKDLVKFMIENADKFEYDENGRITNLEEYLSIKAKE